LLRAARYVVLLTYVMNSNKQRIKTQEGFDIFRFFVVFTFSFAFNALIFVFLSFYLI